MAHKLANWVLQTTTSEGADTIELTGAPPQGYRAFSAVLENGDTTDVVVTDEVTGVRQAATYSYADNTLTFVELIDSSTGDVVEFGPGEKTVSIAPLAGEGGVPGSPQIMASGSVKLSSLLTGSDKDNLAGKLQAFLTSGDMDDRVHVFDRDWSWVFPTRPSLGPQSQYFLPPRYATFECSPGSVLDFSAFPIEGSGSRVYMRRDCSFGTAYAVTATLEKGVSRTIPLSSDNAVALANDIRATRPLPLDADGLSIGVNQIIGARLLLSTTAHWTDPKGGWTQADAIIDFTASISGDQMVVTVGGSGLAAGMQVGGTDVADGTVIVSGPSEGGVGTYTVSPGGQSVASGALRASKGFNRRAESAVVEKIVGNTIYLLTAVQDNYDIDAAPVVQLYLDQPNFKFINPQAIGPGIDRFLQMTGGRTTIIGGELSNFDQMIRVFSSLGGCIRDLTMHGVKPTIPGGGITIGDDTSAYLVDNVTSYGGGQMFMQSGSGGQPGVTRDVLWRDCRAYNPYNGASTHNIAERMTYERFKVYDSRSYAFDMRCPHNTILHGEAWRAARCAILARPIASIGLTVDGFKAHQCLSGFQIDNDIDPYPDFPPGKIIVRHSQFLEIGGLGSHGGISAVFDADPAFPVLAPLEIEGNRVSMANDSPAYRVQGKWSDLRVVDNQALATDSYAPAGRSFIVDAPAANAVADGGPSNVVFTGNRWASSYADAVVRRCTGPTTHADNSIIGQTGTGARALTEDTMLRLAVANGLYTTEDTVGAINVDLPPPNAQNSSEPVTFVLVGDEELNIRSTGLVAIKVGTNAAGFNLRADEDGAEVTLRPLSTKVWNANVTGTWTHDWSPLDLSGDGPWFGIGSAFLTEVIAGDDGSADEDDASGDGEVLEVATRWTDVMQNDIVLLTSDISLAPVIAPAWLDFAGAKYLTEQTPGAGLFFIGAEAGCLWIICKQVFDPSDTGEKAFLSVGGSSLSTRRQISRVVSSGVNRASVVVGDGSTGRRATNGSVDFTGWHWVALIYDGSGVTCVIDGNTSSSTSVTGATTDDRIRAGASCSASADQFCGGKIAHMMQTGILDPSDRADYEAWLTAEVARLNELDP